MRHGLATLGGLSQERSGRAALGHLQPAPGSLLSPTFAPDQLLQLILQGWHVYGGSLYYFSHVKKSWHEAEQFCVSQGAHLASVTSEEEQVRVQPWGDVHGLGMGYGPRTRSRTRTSAHTQDHIDFLLLQQDRAEACDLLGQSGTDV